jgi:hypothetical protein
MLPAIIARTAALEPRLEISLCCRGRTLAWRRAEIDYSVTLRHMGDVPTLYEWAGGRTAIGQMIGCFYDRVERDDLLSPLFPGGVSAAHREHVTT